MNVNDPAAVDSYPSGSIDQNIADNMQALQTGFELARASQLTMLRLQLALYEPNPQSAMQALDILLDIDAEMEGIATTLKGGARDPADDAALSGFIKFQKTAIAAEKHALTGGDHLGQARATSIPPFGGPDHGTALAEKTLLSAGAVERGKRTKEWRWIGALSVAIVVTLIGLGLAIYLLSA